MTYPDYEFHCTLAASRRCFDIPSHQLRLSAAACGYNMENHHHALAAAEACAVIALKILYKLILSPIIRQLNIIFATKTYMQPDMSLFKVTSKRLLLSGGKRLEAGMTADVSYNGSTLPFTNSTVKSEI